MENVSIWGSASHVISVSVFLCRIACLCNMSLSPCVSAWFHGDTFSSIERNEYCFFRVGKIQQWRRSAIPYLITGEECTTTSEWISPCLVPRQNRRPTQRLWENSEALWHYRSPHAWLRLWRIIVCSLCVCACARVCVCACACACECACECVSCVCVRVCVCKCIHLYVYICVWTRACVYLCLCMHMFRWSSFLSLFICGVVDVGVRVHEREREKERQRQWEIETEREREPRGRQSPIDCVFYALCVCVSAFSCVSMSLWLTACYFASPYIHPNLIPRYMIPRQNRRMTGWFNVTRHWRRQVSGKTQKHSCTRGPYRRSVAL